MRSNDIFGKNDFIIAILNKEQNNEKQSKSIKFYFFFFCVLRIYCFLAFASLSTASYHFRYFSVCCVSNGRIETTFINLNVFFPNKYYENLPFSTMAWPDCSSHTKIRLHQVELFESCEKFTNISHKQNQKCDCEW